MSRTPWGDANELRDRRLRPGPGLPRELVNRNQRERLLAAAVVAIAERGYEETTVADLLELAGVSRSSYYRHFPGGKRECFLAALVATTEAWLAQSEIACQSNGDPYDRMALSFDALALTLVDQPAATRIALVDVYGAGAAGLSILDATNRQFALLLAQVLEQSPEPAGVPPPIAAALIGGIRAVLEFQVATGEIAMLPHVMPELREWALSYRNPLQPVRQSRSPPLSTSMTRLVPQDQVNRIFGAIARLVNDKGYPAMTLNNIARTASVSLSTFYRHFGGKEQAFFAAYDAVIAQANAAVTPPSHTASLWPQAVYEALEAYLSFWAAEPLWARVTMVDVLTVGAAALDHRQRALAIFDEILAPGLERTPNVGANAVTAIGGAVHALMRDQIRRRGAEHLLQILPAATFIALAPFATPEELDAVAN